MGIKLIRLTPKHSTLLVVGRGHQILMRSLHKRKRLGAISIIFRRVSLLGAHMHVISGGLIKTKCRLIFVYK